MDARLTEHPGGGELLDRWEGRSLPDLRRRWGIPALEVYALVGSTNDVARARARDGGPAGAAVLAEEQTAGRGRKGRPWFSAPGWSVHLSVVLRPAGGDATLLATLPLRLGLAVAEAVEEAAGVVAGVKWPNDIVVPGMRKLGGILCEAAFAGPRAEAVIAGIGINVGQDMEDFPPELRDRATSVSREAGRLVARAAVLDALFPRLAPLLRPAGALLDPRELAGLRRRDVLRGRPLTVDGAAVGAGAGIEEDGALLVRAPDGAERRIRSGTVRITSAEGSGT